MSSPPRSSTAAVFRPEEYLRIVPLHRPEAARARAQEKLRRDPFDGAAPPRALHGNFTYRGGLLLTSVEVYTIFWGTQWRTSRSGQALVGRINPFFDDILVSPLMDQLAEYSVRGQAIGHGRRVGTTTQSDNAPARTVTDSQIRTQLRAWIRAKTIPRNTRNTLYFVFLDPDVVSVMGGSRSCQNYCGYHNNAGAMYYAVMPYPSCSGCVSTRATFDALTATSSHELCEAVTDPVPGKGWYDDDNGEIGDICAWSFKQVAGHTVQLEWSQAGGACR
jgi:hypothetical protein